jgi:hypothetical protein
MEVEKFEIIMIEEKYVKWICGYRFSKHVSFSLTRTHDMKLVF